MNNDFFKQKIKAFLHDPPEKPLILGLGEAHENRSKRYVETLLGSSETFSKAEWEFADHVASAADRASFPMRETQEFRVNFREPGNSIIKHPNSGGSLDLRGLHDIDPDTIEGNVHAALKRIKELSGNSEEKMFLYLWRCLPEIITQFEQGGEAGKKEIGKLWRYLPADTRIPDHSVHDHARMVSAFAGAGVKKDEVNASLILFTIGPVQEFIAAARKTVDLWSGSYMLSWLSWQAMKVICDELGPDSIIFPDLMGQPLVDEWLISEKGLELAGLLDDWKSDEDDGESTFFKQLGSPTLPNRFFAIVPADQAAVLANRAEKAVNDALQRAGKYAFSELRNVLPENAIDEAEWLDQLENFSECYWAVLDLPDWKKGSKNLDQEYENHFANLFTGIDSRERGKKWEFRNHIYKAFEKGGFNPNLGTFYGRFYEITEKAVGARKSVRNFNQVEESGFRCSLIPGKPALAPAGEKVSPGDYDKFWSDFYTSVQNDKALKNGLLGKNERLSVLALTKRLFPDFLDKHEFKQFPRNRFVSTHSLAVADFKYQLTRVLCDSKNENLNKVLSSFIDAANELLKFITLDKEYWLPKIKYLAKSAGIDSKISVINICTIPGELFQVDYYDGNYIDDLRDQNSYNDIDHKSTVDRVARDAKMALTELIKVSGIASPSKYYAILYLDGDNMGKWLSGDLAPQFCDALHPKAVKSLVDGLEDKDKRQHDLYKGWAKIFNYSEEKSLVERDAMGNPVSCMRPQAPTQHLAISRALNNFSLEIVRRIVEERFLGKLIYAGGDDVVAMVSIGEAVECAETLRAAFSGHLESSEHKTLHNLTVQLDKADSSNGFVGHKWGNRPIISITLGDKATASCGIAIAHYMYPLKQALADARKAEKYAKNDLGRDALAVNIVKRSGESFLTGSKWRLFGNQNGSGTCTLATRIIKDLQEKIQKGWVSPRFIVELEKTLDVFLALPREAVLNEVRRLFYQHSDGFNNMEREASETDEMFEERVKNEKNAFFNNCIGFMIEHCEKILVNSLIENLPKSDIAGSVPFEQAALRNVISLMDMSYYIGKGGGR